MATTAPTSAHQRTFFTQSLLNKVPEVTIFFWIIKVLCTTVGESAADFLNVNLNWGLTLTSVVTGVLFFAIFAVQFALNRYVPVVYWTTVVLISVFGTLVTDNLTDNLGVPLETSTIIFSLLLALTFTVWYSSERTLSIHSITTRKREAFYWLAILFTFALGTAAGDLIAEGLGLGYLTTGIICAVLIGLTTLAWRLGLNAILAFWIAYILTRPLGASLGDFLSQPTAHGGLGLGVTVTSVIFLAAIVATIVYLSIRKPDVFELDKKANIVEPSNHGALLQTVVVIAIFLVVGGAFYGMRRASLEAEATTDFAAVEVTPTPSVDVTSSTKKKGATATPSSAPAAPTANPLGDMSTFITISTDTLGMLNANQQSDATSRIDDLEYEWDNAEATLKRRDANEWTTVDDLIDAVLRELRSTNPDLAKEKASLNTLLTELGAPAQ